MERHRDEATIARIKAIKIVCAVIVIGIVIAVLVYAGIRQALGTGDNMGKTILELKDRYPVLAGLIMMFFCVIQVVIAFIPGELIEQVAGLLFGAWGGLLFCLIGSTLGSCIVILLGNRYGKSLIYAIFPKKRIESNAILANSKSRDFLVFFLFLMPGTPRDPLTYVISLTDMSLPRYLLLTTAARIPSIITSTISGSMIASNISGGEETIKQIMILNGAVLAVAVVGYAIYLIIKLRARKKHMVPTKKAPEKEEKAPKMPSDTEKIPAPAILEEEQAGGIDPAD